jgi:antitoxin component of MazEF toxin-antitoxin module
VVWSILRRRAGRDGQALGAVGRSPGERLSARDRPEGLPPVVARGAGPLSLRLGNLFLEAKHISKIVVVRSMEVLVKKGGIIEIPNSVMVELDLSEGKRLFLNVKDGKILIKPAKNIAERLAGSIALDDVDLIDEIVESEDWL